MAKGIDWETDKRRAEVRLIDSLRGWGPRGLVIVLAVLFLLPLLGFPGLILEGYVNLVMPFLLGVGVLPLIGGSHPWSIAACRQFDGDYLPATGTIFGFETQVPTESTEGYAVGVQDGVLVLLRDCQRIEIRDGDGIEVEVVRSSWAWMGLWRTESIVNLVSEDVHLRLKAMDNGELSYRLGELGWVTVRDTEQLGYRELTRRWIALHDDRGIKRK